MREPGRKSPMAARRWRSCSRRAARAWAFSGADRRGLRFCKYTILSEGRRNGPARRTPCESAVAPPSSGQGGPRPATRDAPAAGLPSRGARAAARLPPAWARANRERPSTAASEAQAPDSQASSATAGEPRQRRPTDRCQDALSPEGLASRTVPPAPGKWESTRRLSLPLPPFEQRSCSPLPSDLPLTAALSMPPNTPSDPRCELVSYTQMRL